MRIIISGGGTGGHIYPALAIAEQFKSNVADVEIIFVGAKNGLENSILKNYDYKFVCIDVKGFKRKFSIDTLSSVKTAFRGLKQSFGIMKKYRPDVVIGTGGYVCGPVVLAAALSGIKTCIQEQNAVPGITNKILARFAERIFLGSPAAEKFFPQKKKIFVTGNPIREEVMKATRRTAEEILRLSINKTTLLVTGGSRGAKSINNAMVYVNEKLAERLDVQVLHVTGEAGFEEVMKKVSNTVKNASNIKIIPYMSDMPLALAATDLAIFRAGALGLSELAARGIPSILIPYPYATANHQEHNARAFEQDGAAIVVRDHELTGENLFGLIEIILEDKERLTAMARAAKLLGHPDAARDIVDNILSML